MCNLLHLMSAMTVGLAFKRVTMSQVRRKPVFGVVLPGTNPTGLLSLEFRIYQLLILYYLDREEQKR